MKLNLSDFQPFAVKGLIRVGNPNDGGYIIPENISVDLLLSFGLGSNWTFERDLVAMRLAKRFVTFDHSVGVIKFGKNLIRSLRTFWSQPLHVVYSTRVLVSYIRDFSFNKRHVKKKVVQNKGLLKDEEISIEEIFEKYVKDAKSIMLKIDIEGDEYKIMDRVLASLQKVQIIILELHDLPNYAAFYLQTKNELERHFNLIHVHGNNYGAVTSDGIPFVCEFTFVRKELMNVQSLVRSLPIEELDSPNNPHSPDIKFDFSKD